MAHGFLMSWGQSMLLFQGGLLGQGQLPLQQFWQPVLQCSFGGPAWPLVFFLSSPSDSVSH